jgi:ABC-type transporter Mla subunit MlaD
MWRLPRVSARRRRLAAFRVAAAELGPAAADLRQLFARAEGALREVVRG